MKSTNSIKIKILSRFPTQGDFAIAVGIHESTVSRVLNLRKRLKNHEVALWAEALECDREDLIAVLDISNPTPIATGSSDQIKQARE